MGLTERHWFENEDVPENIEWALEDAVRANKKVLEVAGWVSVKDRLPEGRTNPRTLDFEPVLCATVFGNIRVYKYGQRLGTTEAHFYDGYSRMDDYVTHWMPIPWPLKENRV